jgi:hypothetical protein
VKRMPPVHPFLFALWLTLAFYSANPDTVSSFREILLPMLIATCPMLILWIPLALLVGNAERAALSVSCAAAVLFSYNLLSLLLPGVTTRLNLNTLVFLLWAVLLVCGLVLPLRVRKHLHAVTTIVNAVVLFLVAFSAIRIASTELRARAILAAVERNEAMQQDVSQRDIKSLPNVYYIILDGYARDDILRQLYQYDNSPFLDYLTRKGFYVARRSTANYNQTALSLASSLNFEYLDGLAKETGLRYPYRTPLTGMTQNSKAMHLFAQGGYQFVALSSGWPSTEMRHANTYIETGHLGLFTNGWIGVCLPKPLMKRAGMQYHIHAKSIQRTFEYLDTTPGLKPPIFVFAHILVPHRPFVFQETGEKPAPNEVFWFSEGSDFIRGSDPVRQQYRCDYRSQLVFINKMVMHTIDEILAKSARPPIIVLQADHGPGSLLDWEDPHETNQRERMGILNAYLLPGGADKRLYDGITPVNTFRVIANHYLGTSFPLLEDKCYYSTWKQPYAFVDVTAEARGQRPDLLSGGIRE